MENHSTQAIKNALRGRQRPTGRNPTASAAPLRSGRHNPSAWPACTLRSRATCARPVVIGHSLRRSPHGCSPGGRSPRGLYAGAPGPPWLLGPLLCAWLLSAPGRAPLAPAPGLCCGLLWVGPRCFFSAGRRSCAPPLPWPAPLVPALCAAVCLRRPPGPRPPRASRHFVLRCAARPGRPPRAPCPRGPAGHPRGACITR